jgi:hypothetical protein
LIEFNNKRKREKEINDEMEYAAALTIQYRYRLRQKGLLKYWPFHVPSYCDTKKKLSLEKNKLNDNDNTLKKEESPLFEDPDNWEICNDGQSNVYYYNKMTGESSWDKPTFQIEGIELTEGPGWEDDDVRSELFILICESSIYNTVKISNIYL